MIQGEMCGKVIGAVRKEPGRGAAVILVGAMNEMFDVLSSRIAAAGTHVWTTVHGALVGSILVAGFLVGQAMTAGGVGSGCTSARLRW